MTEPVLVGCAHGTRDGEGRLAVEALLDAVRLADPDLDVRAAYVDVHPPAVHDVVAAAVQQGHPAVVVPLLLSHGHHVLHDVAAAVQGRPALAAPPLGPDRRVTAVLLDRLATVADDLDVVLLVAAGSSHPAAAVDVEQVADQLRELRAGPVRVAYAAGASPSVPEVLRSTRLELPGRRVVLASYLLAPGHFQRRLEAFPADAVTGPLLLPGPADPRLVDVVLTRYRSAAAALTG